MPSFLGDLCQNLPQKRLSMDDLKNLLLKTMMPYACYANGHSEPVLEYSPIISLKSKYRSGPRPLITSSNLGQGFYY